MKINEIRLYKLKILKNNDILFEGMAEELPEELKSCDATSIVLEDGEAVITV